MTASEEVRVWRLRVRGFTVAGAVCLASIFLLKVLDPTEFAKSFILPLVLLLVFLWLCGYIAPTGIGKILEKMKYGAADQRKPLAQNGMNCTRPLARSWRAALDQSRRFGPRAVNSG